MFCSSFNLNEIYDSDFNKKDSLSGGEKQKLSLARIFSKKSSLIILDEPLTFLDAETKRTVVEIIKKMASDKIVIIVTHEDFDMYSDIKNNMNIIKI